MLKLNDKDFELNALFNYELLKQLLLELAKSQSKLENEMNKMKISNEKRDKIMMKLKERLDNNFFDDDQSESQENTSNEEENGEEEPEKEKELTEKKEPKKEKKDKKDDQKSEKSEQKNEKEEEKNENEDEKNENEEEKEENDEQKNENEEEKKSDVEQKEVTDNEKTEDNIEKSKEHSKNDVIEIKNKSKENQIKENQNLASNNDNINDTNENNEQNENEISNNDEKVESPKKENIEQNKDKKPKDKKNKSPTKTEKTHKKESKNQTPNSKNKNNDNAEEVHVSPELIRNIARQVKDNKAKIAELTKRLKKETETLNKNIGDKIADNNVGIQSDFSLVNKRIDDVEENMGDLDKKIEDCIVKCSTFDIYEMFKDSGDGTIDATKVMCRALEEKVFKKFQLVDARYKKDAADNLKSKNYLDSLGPKLDKMNKDISKLFEENNQKGEDIKNVRDDYQKENQEIKNNIEDSGINIMQKINNITNELNNNLKNKIDDIEKQISDMKKSGYASSELLELGFRSNNNQEVLNDLEKKLNDLRRKIHDLENTFKLHLESKEIDEIKNELKDHKILLDKKITKDSLKELYNFHSNVVDDINDLKEHARISYEDLRKLNAEISRIYVKLENIDGNILLMQNNPNNNNGNKPTFIDFTKYVDQKKFTDTIKPILKEIEKIYREIDSLRRDLTDADDQIHTLDNKERLNNLEEDLNNKINEIKIQIKKFVEKAEFHKNIKQLEVQLKSIDTNKKNEGDSWIMAKRPIKCFNCASCEANIKNITPTNEYLAWNKYPQGEKIYRMGQGFSHMLQMMTSEFVKSIGENAELENTNPLSSRNINIGSTFLSPMNTNGGRERSGSFIKINNREQVFDDKLAKRLNESGKGKVKLPRVLKMKNYGGYKFDEIPLTDDELKNENENSHRKTPSSPKILKIVKKGLSSSNRSESLANGNVANTIMNYPITEGNVKKAYN